MLLRKLALCDDLFKLLLDFFATRLLELIRLTRRHTVDVHSRVVNNVLCKLGVSVGDFDNFCHGEDDGFFLLRSLFNLGSKLRILFLYTFNLAVVHEVLSKCHDRRALPNSFRPLIKRFTILHRRGDGFLCGYGLLCRIVEFLGLLRINDVLSIIAHGSHAVRKHLKRSATKFSDHFHQNIGGVYLSPRCRCSDIFSCAA